MILDEQDTLVRVLVVHFCAERCKRESLLITTNLEFARWVEVFGDAILTGALLDRLTHHAQIMLFQGESHRFRDGQQRAEASRPGKHLLHRSFTAPSGYDIRKREAGNAPSYDNN